MNETERREMIERYLRRLARELEDVPAGAREELIEDVRSHIAEAWEGAPEHNRATLLNILGRLGEPEGLAREERERLGLEAAPQRQDADVVSVAAIVFMVVFWPLGVLLTWISSRWSAGDKAIATLIPVLGLFLGMLMSMALLTTTTRVETHQVPSSAQTEPQQSPETAQQSGQTDSIGRNLRAFAGRALAFYGFLGAPLTSAAYLAVRLRRRTRRWASLIPIAAGVLVGTMFLVLFLAPVDTSAMGVQSVPQPASITREVGGLTP